MNTGVRVYTYIYILLCSMMMLTLTQPLQEKLADHCQTERLWQPIAQTQQHFLPFGSMPSA
jgi:hypothetical protein